MLHIVIILSIATQSSGNRLSFISVKQLIHYARLLLLSVSYRLS